MLGTVLLKQLPPCTASAKSQARLGQSSVSNFQVSSPGLTLRIEKLPSRRLATVRRATANEILALNTAVTSVHWDQVCSKGFRLIAISASSSVMDRSWKRAAQYHRNSTAQCTAGNHATLVSSSSFSTGVPLAAQDDPFPSCSQRT